jgi:hypothetical protein
VKLHIARATRHPLTTTTPAGTNAERLNPPVSAATGTIVIIIATFGWIVFFLHIPTPAADAKGMLNFALCCEFL